MRCCLGRPADDDEGDDDDDDEDEEDCAPNLSVGMHKWPDGAL